MMLLIIYRSLGFTMLRVIWFADLGIRKRREASQPQRRLSVALAIVARDGRLFRRLKFFDDRRLFF
jgi:hypothetical protein